MILKVHVDSPYMAELRSGLSLLFDEVEQETLGLRNLGWVNIECTVDAQTGICPQLNA